MRAARLRASKLPNPVICTFAPFFSSPAMMPLSSNRASIARPASAFDILVRMASAAVSSALFTVSPCEGLGLKPLEIRPFHGGAPANPHKTATIWGYPPEIRKIRALSSLRVTGGLPRATGRFGGTDVVLYHRSGYQRPRAPHMGKEIHMKKNLGMLLLGIWLVLHGLIQVVNFSFS